MTTTIQLRQKNPEETDKMAKIDSPEDVYGYLSRNITDSTGEYLEVRLGGDGVEIPATGVTGNGSGNYVTFEEPGGNIVGFGVHLSILEELLDFEVERDSDGNVLNAPESIAMKFAESSEEAYEEADGADPEAADALLA